MKVMKILLFSVMAVMFFVLMLAPKWVMALIVSFLFATGELTLSRVKALEQRELIRRLFK